jgi:hypothetical protein
MGVLDFSFNRQVYCHDLINPPSQSGSCYVAMNLTNSTGLMSIEKVALESAETIYLISIPSGHNLGFMTSEQFALEEDFSNLVLAFNLTLKRICVNSKRGDFPQFSVTPKVPELKTSVTKSDGGSHIHSEETVVFRDESYTGIGIWGEIEEDKVADIFRKIQKLKRFEKKDVSELQTLNLNDALSKYESGISEFDRLVKFKHFFNSLELATNMAGTDLKGKDFDNEVHRISSVSKSDAKNWREFYNRTKHVQEDSDDINRYYEGVDTLILTSRLLAIRTSLNKLLLSKL